MVCCALLSLVIALALCLVRRAVPQACRAGRSPLAWRLHGATVAEPVPASPAPFSLSARLRSVGFALAGLRFLVRNEHNARIHLAATVLVVATGFALGIDGEDWRWLAAAVLWVWFAEAVNTALESLCDLVSPGANQLVRTAKDVAAGAVLVSAVAAVILGAVTLLPYVAPLAAGAVPDALLCRGSP